MNSRQYHQYRQRLRARWIDAHRPRTHPDYEGARLIEFARMWAPYGGAPEGEILVHFGMTTHRFTERLWQLIPESHCGHDEVRSLTSAYPRHRRPLGFPPFRYALGDLSREQRG